jgi:hypothetical protein
MTIKACCLAFTLLLIVAISGVVSAGVDVSGGVIATSNGACGNNFGKCNDDCKLGDNCDGSLWNENKWQDTMTAAWDGSNNDDKKCDGNKCDDFKWLNFMWDDFKWFAFTLDDFKFDGNTCQDCSD